ncbi:hypothetical protein FE257_000823 [Aspergillus nanangensis]|uniref:FAD-binding PCMH-type domain-containing protein n=1 Tax=Aspergillus nanangensis TaxID=2582783 RepID=A0AAD4CEL7_ASPNN|nr:hypothetical protein FE257_000823 [Aspergillus nanangensis]
MSPSASAVKQGLEEYLPDHVSITISGDPDYASTIATWNIRAQYRPLAVVQPTTAPEVSTLIKRAQELGVTQIAIRGGGHSFEGLSLGGQDGAFVIDMRKMDHVFATPEKNEVTAQGGALLSQVHLAAYRNGHKMVPLGTCPSVGIAGQVQCGGYGFYSRTYGPMVDRALAFEIVTADGEIRQVDDYHDSDLFYALRGSGVGSFGVITAVTLRTNDIPASIANFSVRWKLADSDIPSILKALQRACLGAPSSMNAMVMAWLGQFEVFGTILATSDSERDTNWRNFLDALPESNDARIEGMDFLTSVMDISKRQTSAPFYQTIDEVQREWDSHLRCMKIKSGFLPKPLTDEDMDRMGQFWKTQPSTGVRVQLLALDPGHTPQSDSTSIRARGCPWLMGMSVYITQKECRADELMSEAEERMPWLNQAYELFRPLSVGAYVGDDDLEEGAGVYEGYMASFYGRHLPRLSQVKARYDPGNLFHHALSIPVAGGG